MALTAMSGCGGGGGGPTAGDGSVAVDGGDPGQGTDAGRSPDAGPGLDAGGNPCGVTLCTPGQRCEVADGGAQCIDNACSDLNCGPTERCEPHPAGGHTCVTRTCSSDVGCPADEYCNAGVCVDDVCEANTRRCVGGELLECSSNGGQEAPRLTCGGGGYFASVCEDNGMGDAGCSCEDDWDCPAFTVCQVNRCVGTGVAPTCTLPPIPFAEVPPTVEIFWGGESRANDTALDGTAARNEAPWSDFGHVVSTPVVANLDDDNGDGLINELDFPEILFTAHQGSNPWGNGVLRAIHGGGPNKGADYFARCGGKLWTRAAPTADTCGTTEPDLDSGSPVAVGDLDNDGVPEIVVNTEGRSIHILDNRGAEIYAHPSDGWTPNEIGETPTITNLDYSGFAEIVVGRTVFVLGEDGSGDLIVTHVLQGAEADGSNEISRMACPADVLPAVPGQEIVAGATLYRLPTPLAPCPSPPCAGTLQVVWNAPDVGSQASALTGDGFCAVADVWGADPTAPPGPGNPPDGQPEVILIDDGDLTVLDASTGTIIEDRDLIGGDRGGAPNVDDFDGDGFMEIASALQNFYVVVDLQSSTGSAGSCPEWPTTIARIDGAGGSHNPNPPRSPGGACTSNADCDLAAVCNTTLGACVCLHNGWQRDSDDDSSRATSSSVFDFNGDGAAEVLYNDECDFRVYDGANGEILFSAVSRSRTGIENPVVADVDNDGNAEVVAGMNTAEGNRCDEDGASPIGPNGIRVWGDVTDTWVSARRIWNQQSYHVTNVTEGATIPTRAPESWRALNGRLYNTYRSQPRSFGVAPDLSVVAVGISSPDVACGSLSTNIDIAYQIENAGDLRVGPGVVVEFIGIWDALEEPLLDDAGSPIRAVLTTSLEPGRSVILSVPYSQSDNPQGRLPDRVRVVVDPVTIANPAGAERECDESNNSLEQTVDPGSERADLRIAVGSVERACPDVRVTLTVTNDGTVAASQVVVRYFAGDPSAGGMAVGESTLAQDLGPGSSQTFTATIMDFPLDRNITVYAVADPDDTIEECNEANNTDAATEAVICDSVF